MVNWKGFAIYYGKKECSEHETSKYWYSAARGINNNQLIIRVYRKQCPQPRNMLQDLSFSGFAFVSSYRGRREFE